MRRNEVETEVQMMKGKAELETAKKIKQAEEEA
jgi:hypothetical protein